MRLVPSGAGALRGSAPARPIRRRLLASGERQEASNAHGVRRGASASRAAFVAWTPVGQRAGEIADALGGQAFVVYLPRLDRRSLAPLRYAISAVRTASYLVRQRPRVVIATNPPIIPGLLAWLYGALSGATVILDDHPAAFGAQHDDVSKRLQRQHRWLASRVTACLVTAPEWVRRLESWGATGLTFHEAPPQWRVAPPQPLTGHPRVLFVGTFGGDEPVDEVIRAARLRPDMEIRMTGRLSRCPKTLIRTAPRNVRFLGFLSQEAYVRELEAADVVVTLSTEPTSVMRAGYEAVYARRPLVVSDWPTLREVFPAAVHTANNAAALAAALDRAVAEHPRLREAADDARQLQLDRVACQLQQLQALLPAEDRGDRGLLGEELPEHSPRADVPHTEIRLGLPSTFTTWPILEAWAKGRLEARSGGLILTLAPYQAYLALTEQDYRARLRRGAIVLIDGNGVRFPLRLAGYATGPRLTGRELVERAFTGEFLGGSTVAVLGGAEETGERLRQLKPSWLTVGGRFAERPSEEDVRRVAATLRSSGAELVLVALPSPKSALWAERLHGLHPALYAIIGGAVETVTGVKRAPPRVVCKLSLEWAWRLAQDPRLAGRLARGSLAVADLTVRAALRRIQGIDG